MEIKEKNKIGIPQIAEGLSRRMRQLLRRGKTGREETVDPAGGEPPSSRPRLTKKKLAAGVGCALLAIAILVAILVGCFPVYQIHSSSMSPQLAAGDTVVCLRGNSYGVGDIVAVKHHDMILIRRIVASGGDYVTITPEGKLLVNDTPVDEPYATPAEGERPYSTHVPLDFWYILGDNRRIQGDSRLSEIGTVSDEDIIGRVIITI